MLHCAILPYSRRVCQVYFLCKICAIMLPIWLLHIAILSYVVVCLPSLFSMQNLSNHVANLTALFCNSSLCCGGFAKFIFYAKSVQLCCQSSCFILQFFPMLWWVCQVYFLQNQRCIRSRGGEGGSC